MINQILSLPHNLWPKTKAGAIIGFFGHEVVDVDFPRVKESEISREYFRRSIRNFAIDLSKKAEINLQKQI